MLQLESRVWYKQLPLARHQYLYVQQWELENHNYAVGRTLGACALDDMERLEFIAYTRHNLVKVHKTT